MALAKAIALPRLDSIHVLRSMGGIVFPIGETLQQPNGEFLISPMGGPIPPMEPVEETRRSRLRMLVTQFGSMAELCQELGYARTETATLTRILNANIRHDREGKPYNMGSPMARQIEDKLKKPLGWMDTPPTYVEMFGDNDPRAKVMQLMEAMPPDQWPTVVRLVDAVSQPAAPTGTTGH